LQARLVLAPRGCSIGNQKWIDKTRIATLASMTANLTPKGTRTRQRIVDTAAELMFVRGVIGTTLEEVKAAAAVSSSQLYHYFEDKPALVRAVIEQQTDAVVGTQEPLLAGIDSIDGLRAWRDSVVDLERQLECRGGCPIGSLGSQLAEVDPSSRQQVSASFVRWESALQRALRSMHERGALAPEADPDALSLALLAAVQGGLLLAQIHRSTRPLEAALDTVLDHIATRTT
jgi:TetR/AcrR family transcriptional regulator, transcriptional repressor for nem operon